LRLRQIQDFLAIIEEGSIHAAARKLGLSQPAVTKSLRGLESELDAQLVRRTNQGVAPTEAGRALYARARLANSELRKAQEEIAQLTDTGAGSVAFGTGVAAGILIVPEAIAMFRRQYPLTRIRIQEGFPSTLFSLVRNATLDFAIGPRPAGNLDPAYAYVPLFRHDWVIVARKKHPLRDARSLAQLANADWLTMQPVNTLGRGVDRLFSPLGLSAPNQVIECESYNILVALLAKTDMLAIVSKWMLTEPFARDSLVSIPVAEALPSSAAGMFTRTGSTLTKPAAALAKAITAVARQLAIGR
jgi:DNA-binding transcriptional LysR family regulator